MINQFRTNNVRLCRKFSFEAAHFLPNYQGDCKHVHGHSYHLEVCVRGMPLLSEGHPNDGMLIDSCLLKKIVTEQILDNYDHRLIVNASQRSFIQSLSDLGMKLVITDFQPTIENLILAFASILSNSLPENVKLCNLKLHETGTTFCEWHASDN